MVPHWFSAGSAIVIVGALLIMIGYIVQLVGIASLSATTTLDSLKGFLEASAALIGTGFFLAALGWVFHQAAVYRRFQR